MTYQDTYSSFRDALTSTVGIGPTSTVDAQALPNISPMNMMSILGWTTPFMAQALNNFNRSSNAAGEDNVAVQVDTTTGTPVGTGLDGLMAAAASGTSSANLTGLAAGPYLAAPTADASRAWLRTPDPANTDSVFSVWTNSQDSILAFVEQTISDWQAMCNWVATAILGGADLSQPSPVDDIQGFWSAFGSWCSDMDVLNENPPTDINIVEALKFSLDTTTKYIGDSAAEIAKTVGEQAAIVAEGVGKTAAGLASGFFNNAGLLSVAVAGIAVYLFVK